MSERILVVDDDDTLRQTLAEVLARHYEVDQAADAAAALVLAGANSYGLALLDLRLPDGNGLDVLGRLHEIDDRLLVVVMTAYPEVRTAVSALKAGAYDYLNKPFDLDDLRGLVARALETQRLRSEVERLRVVVPPPASLEGMIGQSPAFLATAEMTRRIAAAPRTPVLIRGESGTGKERIAQAIHSLSSRAAGPWVTLNCSAIAEGLLESEMFGHEKGAFTDAVASKRGLLELADGGTLFLDEIGDLSPALQPKLLRAIETQSFRRVGGGRELKVDVRFVAATNRDLNELIRQGRFREDLYYRLNVAGIDVPPLRERREDILPLARHFLAQAATVMGLKALGVTPAAEGRLAAYVWPGNVRELRNVLERALILSGGETIRPEHLPKELCTASNCQSRDGVVQPFAMAEMEKLHIARVLRHCHGNKTHAAALLGITRLTLRNKIRLYELGEFQDEGE
ncbi:MAG: sigma-54-dependent Fis family transcriptional regulator [Thiobacillus sp.]|nr:sigma-54-dependent Fis family transcriptional regulator [Thiobacillus sp.]